MQKVNTRCLANILIITPFSFDKISSGASRMEKPRALAGPTIRFGTRFMHSLSISSVLTIRKTKPLAIQNITRTAFSSRVSLFSNLLDKFHRMSVADEMHSMGRNLFDIRAICLRILCLMTFTSSRRARATSFSSRLAGFVECGTKDGNNV